jgi:hypothetical protein
MGNRKRAKASNDKLLSMVCDYTMSRGQYMRKAVATMMLGVALAVSSGAVRAENKAAQVQGDYIEARSASVYAGPCHYSNEAVTDGRTATVAWRFTDGSWNGVNLKGLSAVAVINAKANLAEDTKSRRSVLYLDARATPQQVGALRSLFSEKYGAMLGQVVATRAASTQVSNDGLNYRVRVDGVAQLDVNRYPCTHCTQDAQIWYQPLAPAQNVIVGKTTRTSFSDKALDISWDDRQEANSAFVGTFTL